MNYIGIDIGTSSICGVRHNPDTGENRILTKSNDSSIATREPWSFLQDAQRILHLVKEILEELLTEDVASIGFSGQMHGMVYLDGDGKAVSPLYTWQDGSGDQPYKDGKSYAQWLSEKTGHKVSTGYGIVTHFYHQQNQTIPDTARHLCTVMDYVVMNLCGAKEPICEPSNASSLGFFDKRRMQFDTEALSSIGLDIQMLPSVREANTIVGHLPFKEKSIPVYVSIGDNQASYLGSVKDRESSVLITIGTSSQLSVFSPDYVEIDPLDTRTLPGGGYILVGAALCGGCSLTMLKDFFGKTVAYFSGQQMADEELYDRMFGEYTPTQPIPSVETTFEGTRANPSQKGSITGISLKNFSPETLIEGFMQGICKELHDFYLKLPAHLREGRTQLVASGNALRRNARLRQILSDTFGLPLTLTPHTEEAAMGAITFFHLSNLKE